MIKSRYYTVNVKLFCGCFSWVKIYTIQFFQSNSQVKAYFFLQILWNNKRRIFLFFADRLVCKYTEMTTTTLWKLFMQQWTTCVQAYFSLTTLPPPSFFLGGNEVSCHYIFCGLYIYTLCLFLCVLIFFKYIRVIILLLLFYFVPI